MSLENSFGNDDASELGATYASSSQLITLTNSAFQQRKFVVPFQGGFDGVNPAKARNTGTDITAANTQGFDITNSTSSGSVVYKRAINAISNPDEFDINLLSTPGIVHSLHSQVTNHAIDKIESRADAFYIMDGSPYGATIQQAIDNVSSLDTNYVGTYYPWVKVLDSVKNKPTWEGYDFNEFAILYCFEQILSEITVTRIQNGLSGASEEAIKEEAKSQTYLGVYPEITDMAIESYNKSVNEGSMGPIQSAILKLLGDKSLDFDAPAVKAVKGFFKKIF